MSTIAPSRSRKALFGAILALLLVALLELGSIVVLYALGGKLFTPGAARAEREAVQRQAAQRSNVTVPQPAEPTGAKEGPAHRDWPPEVVHPFLGFVRDPTAGGAKFELSDLGFFKSKPPAGPPEKRLAVGIFGGSVAVGLSRSQRLIDELQSLPAFDGRSVWIRSFALGGYKQPQQLIALNYALALGERIDIVINLDGFNDIALAPREREASGLNPFYPRRWSRRVANLPRVESQRLIGEITFLEAKRAERQGCSWAPFSWSPSCHLVWKLFDVRTLRQLTALRKTLSEQKATQRPYLTLGPEAEYASRSELLQDLVELWGRGSLQMQQLCEAQGIEYFHFLQPNQYVPGSKPLSRAEQRQAFVADHPWGEIIPEGYPMLVEEGRQLAERGVRFHDLSQVFAGVSDTLYVDSCCHFNKQGMNRVASAIARAVDQGLTE